MRDVPVGVKIIAALLVVSALFTLAALAIAWPSLRDADQPAVILWAAGLAVTLISLGVAAGLLRLKRWAWWAAAVLALLSLSGALLQVWRGTGRGPGTVALKVLTAALILWYLLRASTRSRFAPTANR